MGGQLVVQGWSGWAAHLLPGCSAAHSVYTVCCFQGQQADLLDGYATFSDPVRHDLLEESEGGSVWSCSLIQLFLGQQ